MPADPTTHHSHLELSSHLCSPPIKLLMRSVRLSKSIACLIATAGILSAQPAPNSRAATLATQLRTATNNVLNTHAEARRNNAPASAALNARAAQQLQSRAATLLALMAENPGEAIKQSLSADAADDINNTFPGNARFLEEHGQWQGPVEKSVIDAMDGSSRAIYGLTVAGQNLTVHLAGPDLNVKCQDVIAFQGIKLQESVAASGAIISAAATPCGSKGDQKIAILMITFPGIAAPGNVTATGVKDIMQATTGRSVDDFWRKASYNQTWVTTADVYGWYTLDRVYTCNEYSAMRSAAIAAADADVNFLNYNRLFLILPDPGGCGWAGLGNVGCTSFSSADGTVTASTSWMLANYFASRDYGVKLTLHEGGHNLGLMHSRSRDFGLEPLGAIGTLGTYSEYGDPNSTMGYWNFGHYTGYQKQSLGWQATSNVATVQSTGTYSILPTEIGTASTQTLKVKRGTDNTANAWLWLEYRQPVDTYDNTLNAQMFTGALVHYQDNNTGTYTDLLDFTRANTSFADAALAQGQTWVDPYSNLSISVTSATTNALTVNVNYGPIPCVRNAPTVTTSPANPSAYAGASVNYTLAITNNDSAGCAASTFNLTSTLPAGFGTAFSVASVALTPGQATNLTMTKTIPAGTTPAVYPVDASASSTDSTNTGTANLTVMAPPPALTVTASTNSASYATRSNVTMSAKVLSGANAAAGATVVFKLTKPNGSTTTKTATASSTGIASWSYRLGVKDPIGTYTVTATATFSPLTSTSAPVTFTVK